MTSISSSPRKQGFSPSSPQYYHSPSPSPPLHQYHRSHSLSASTERSRDRVRLRQRSRETHLSRSRSRERDNSYRHEYASRPSRDYQSFSFSFSFSFCSSHSHSAPRKRHRHYDRRNRSPSSSYEKRSRDRIPIPCESHSLSASNWWKRRRHYHSRHRSQSSSTERSRDQVRLGQRSRETHLSRSRSRQSLVESHLSLAKSRDRHSRHRHDYLSRPSRYMRNYPLERRNESPIARQSPLLLYRHFINGLADNILPDEAFRRYKPYLHQLRKGFFAAHKNDPGLKRLYHPSYIEIAINKRNEHANKVARNFFEDLQNGTLILLPLNPPGNAVRHLTDLNRARLLIAKVDADKGIHENLLLSSQQNGIFAQFVHVKNSDGSITTLGRYEMLNVVITYLWDVHAINYYGMAELGKDLITFEENNLAAAEVEQRLDSAWQGRLQAGDPLNLSVGKYKMECLVNRNLCAHFAIVEKEKGDGHIKIIYVCKENSCGKCCKLLP